MPVTTSFDKRFRRSHVKATRTRSGWLRHPWRLARGAAVSALVLYAGYRGAILVMRAPLLKVAEITVRGNGRLSTGEVLSMLDGLSGQNILFADLERCRRRLLASAWVGDANVRRVLPSTIEVLIVERHPIGVARLGGELFLVDERGTVIDEYGPRYGEMDLPIIDGLTGRGAGGPESVDGERSALAARLLAAVKTRPDLARRISQVDVTDATNAEVVLDDDGAVVRLGDSQFVERLQSYVELAPTLHDRVPSIDYVDLRFGERVYVGPAATMGRPHRTDVTATGGAASKF